MTWWLVWRSCSSVSHMNKGKLYKSQLVQGLYYHFWLVLYHHSIYPGPLSLAIPLWVGAMSTGDGFAHHWEERLSGPEWRG